MRNCGRVDQERGNTWTFIIKSNKNNNKTNLRKNAFTIILKIYMLVQSYQFCSYSLNPASFQMIETGLLDLFNSHNN